MFTFFFFLFLLIFSSLSSSFPSFFPLLFPFFGLFFSNYLSFFFLLSFLIWNIIHCKSLKIEAVLSKNTSVGFKNIENSENLKILMWLNFILGLYVFFFYCIFRSLILSIGFIPTLLIIFIDISLEDIFYYTRASCYENLVFDLYNDGNTISKVVL